MSWHVTIDQVDAELWSVFGTDPDNGDHMGSSVVGDEQTARDFAAALFGGDAEPTVSALP